MNNKVLGGWLNITVYNIVLIAEIKFYLLATLTEQTYPPP